MEPSPYERAYPMAIEDGYRMTDVDIVPRGRGRRSSAEIEQQQAAAEALLASSRSVVRRMSPEALDSWLLMRLNDQWGERPERMWRDKFANFAASNDYLLITNDQAVLLAMVYRDPITMKHLVMERFVWCRASDKKDGMWQISPRSYEEGELAGLYRYLRDWARSFGAARLYVGYCSDMLPSRILGLFGGDAYYTIGVPV